MLATTASDGSGHFSFVNLVAGTFTIAEEPRTDWIQTSSPVTYRVNSTPGEELDGLNLSLLAEHHQTARR